MSNFQQEVEDISDGRAVYFDSLDFDTQCALVGLYLLENYGAPDEIEPLVESMSPGVNEESIEACYVAFSTLGLAISLYSHMADGEPPRDTLSGWGLELVRAIVKTYSGLVQGAIDGVLDRAGPDDDMRYEMERDRRMGL
jgi:hypothetical protein